MLRAEDCPYSILVLLNVLGLPPGFPEIEIVQPR
jgi:hypothetical protein